MRAHLVQFDIAWEDKNANFQSVSRLLASAHVAKRDLIVLPEMFDTGFSLNVEITNDSDGKTLHFLQTLARETGCFIQGAQTIRKSDGKGLNRATVLDPSGNIITTYDKIHPFSFGREPERFVGGDQITDYEWKSSAEVRVCPAICYDLRFPELFRAGLDRGTQVFAIGANWPAPRAEHWRALIIARAIENQAYVLGVNRCGSDPHLSYDGGSLIVDPKGRVVAEAGSTEAVLSAPIEARAVDSWRQEFPAVRDRRREPWNAISRP